MDPSSHGRRCGIHVSIVGLLLVVEHHRHDDHHDVGFASRGRCVRRGPQSAAPVGVLNRLGEAGLLGDVRASLVDRVDDRLLDVDGDDRPPVPGKLGRQRQAHLAGAHDGHGANAALFPEPRLDASRSAMPASRGR